MVRAHVEDLGGCTRRGCGRDLAARILDAFIADMGITVGMKVLDLGCGDGTAALTAARLGVVVPGVDIARNLVVAERRASPTASFRRATLPTSKTSKTSKTLPLT